MHCTVCNVVIAPGEVHWTTLGDSLCPYCYEEYIGNVDHDPEW